MKLFRDCLPILLAINLWPAPRSAAQTNLTNCFCAVGSSSELCSYLPHNINPAMEAGYFGLSPATQRTFDLFSWQSFVALNWPATANGAPATNSITDPATAAMPRVWDSYTTSEKLYKLPGVSPAARALATRSSSRVLRLTAKSEQLSGFSQATGQPLIDRNFNFVLYEIRVNPEEANYVLKNQLNTVTGQEKFLSNNVVDFPQGSVTGEVGAIEIKAAWRILDPATDDTNRFYTTTAVIDIPATSTLNHQPLTFTTNVGLVGMHILHKAFGQTNWIWSTFEQVDNAPTSDEDLLRPHQWSFYNTNAFLKVPIDMPPPTTQYLWASQPPYAISNAWTIPNLGTVGTQVRRLYPIYAETKELNALWQNALTNTVWANYQLVGTQWAAGSDGPPPYTLVAAPAVLANTVAETYIQSSASCIGCHTGATTHTKPAKFADFSFLLGLAH